MDISKLISVSCVPTGGFGSQDEEEAEDGGLGEVHSRDLLYKRRGIKFSGNTKENLALRHIREKERRKSCRIIQHAVGRNILEDDEEESRISITKVKQSTVFPPPVTPNTRKALSKSRREKLAEYLEEKKKLEELKRKQSKPAFRAGKVRHDPTPFPYMSKLNGSTRSCIKGSTSTKSSQQSLKTRVSDLKMTPIIQIDPSLIKEGGRQKLSVFGI